MPRPPLNPGGDRTQLPLAKDFDEPRPGGGVPLWEIAAVKDGSVSVRAEFVFTPGDPEKLWDLITDLRQALEMMVGGRRVEPLRG